MITITHSISNPPHFFPSAAGSGIQQAGTSNRLPDSLNDSMTGQFTDDEYFSFASLPFFILEELN